MIPSSMAGAIVARLNESMVDLLPGGVARGLRTVETPVPYGSLADITAADWLTTGRSYYAEALYQLTIVARSIDDLETIADRVKAVLRIGMVPLEFQAGTHGIAVAGPLRYMGEEVADDGTSLHQGYIEITTGANRSY